LTSGSERSNAAPESESDRQASFGPALWVIVAAGLLLRFVPVLQAEFPFGDGGLYHAYIRDLMASGFVPPLTASYNGGISFPYPFLAFELVAVIASLTGIEPIVLLRFLPPVISGLSVVAFAWLARELLGGRRLVLVATFLFATLPEGYRSSILGGGITKALMTLLVLVALVAGARAFRTGSRRTYALCGLLIGLAQLTHPDGGLAAAIGLLFVLLLVGPKGRRLLGFVATGLIALVVSAPWWLRVMVELGPGPILSAAGNGGGLLSEVFNQAIQLIRSSGVPLLAAGLAIAVLEAVLHPSRRLLLLGAWTLPILLLDQRNAYMDFPVPAALLAAAGLESFITRTWAGLLRNRPGPATAARRLIAVVAPATGAVAVAVLLVVPGMTGPRDQLRAPDLDALRAVREQFEPGTRFLVVTGSPWYADDVSEWFPALSEGVSVVTPQGSEWHGAGVFDQAVEDHAAAQSCSDETMQCVDAWSAATHIPFDAIYVAGPEAESSREPQPTVPEALGVVPTSREDCCAPLRASLVSDPGWRVVSNGAGAVIAVRTGTLPAGPLARPFAAPVTTGTYDVPASIDATGATDASEALNAWTSTLPDGSVISFDEGATYRLDVGLLLEGRTNIVLEGNGATLRLAGGGNDEAASAFLLRGSNHVAIHDFTVVGNNPNTTTIYEGDETAHVLSLSGWYGGPPSSFVEISDVTASHIYGDGAYLEGRNVAPHEPSHDVWIHDNDWSYIGRNAISSINVTDLLVEDNHFDRIGGAAWDIEPNFAEQVVLRNTFRNNRVGSYSHMIPFVGWFVSSFNVTGQSTIDRITVSGNIVAGNPAAGNDGTPRGLNSKFEVPNTSNVVFENNTTTQAAEGPVLYFVGVENVTVTGNRQAVISGALAGFVNCSGVVYP
jgi:hypothetical protein